MKVWEKLYFVSNLKVKKYIWGHCGAVFTEHILQCVYLQNDTFNFTWQQSEFGHNEEMCCSEFSTYFVYSPDNVTDMHKQSVGRISLWYSFIMK